MKYKLSITLLIAAVAFISCNNSDDSETEDVAAATIMNESLAKMGAENDSLVIHHAGPLYHHHDSIFHHHDSIYVHEHIIYHHGDTIHHHDGTHHNEDQHHQHDSIVISHHNIAH
ncbi:MAG: hypothetical protein ABIQ27_10575 [Flavobacterium sp.]|uniref:hypothetical protein n=1 Tax=Flavobacterium sp. TaxID=239 RepID=UPI003263CD6A